MKTGTQYIAELRIVQQRARERGDDATVNRLQIVIDDERRELLKHSQQRMQEFLHNQNPKKW